MLEESDKEMVAHPEIYIENGNHVFSLHIDNEVAGAVALKKHKNGDYELTKMAVDIKFRGHGVGQHLMTAIETYAKTRDEPDPPLPAFQHKERSRAAPSMNAMAGRSIIQARIPSINAPISAWRNFYDS